MRKTIQLITMLFGLIYLSCLFSTAKSTGGSANKYAKYIDAGIDTSLGYLPLQKGNYWKYTEESSSLNGTISLNCTDSITDTQSIGGTLCYNYKRAKYNPDPPHAGTSVQYYTYELTSDQKLYNRAAANPSYRYLIVDFGKSVGDTFYKGLEGETSVKITVAEKTDYYITFKSAGSTTTYIKGLGEKQEYSKAYINGQEYMF